MATTPVALYRLMPSELLRSHDHGYEVISPSRTLPRFRETMNWVEEWCPDAAQFVLVDAPRRLDPRNCESVVEAVGESTFAGRLRLACCPDLLRNRSALRLFAASGIRLVLQNPDPKVLAFAMDAGIVGVRLRGESLASLRATPKLAALLSEAQRLCLRSIASQLPRSAEPETLFDLGVDYVSYAGSGMRPVNVEKWLRVGRTA